MSRSLSLFGTEPFFGRQGLFPSFMDFPLSEFNRDFAGTMTGHDRQPTMTLDKMRKQFFSSLESDVKEDSRHWNLCMDVTGFKPEEITIKMTNRDLHLEGKHETNSEDGKHHKLMSFKRHYLLPETINLETLKSKLTPDGVLVVTATKTMAIDAKGETLIPIEFTKPSAMEQ